LRCAWLREDNERDRKCRINRSGQASGAGALQEELELANGSAADVEGSPTNGEQHGGSN
jgi:hypothetical protein